MQPEFLFLGYLLKLYINEIFKFVWFNLFILVFGKML